MIFKNWFKNFPEKVLGIETEGTDRFGKEIIIIKGDLSLLAKIDVSEALNPTLRETAMEVDLEALNNIQSSLRKASDKKKVVSKIKDVSTSKLYLKPVIENDLLSEEEAFNVLNKGYGYVEVLDDKNEPVPKAVIDDNDIEVWVYYCIQNSRPLHPYLLKRFKRSYVDSWLTDKLKNGFLCFDPIKNEYVPRVIYYAGNIAEKIQHLRNASFNEPLRGEVQKELQIKTLLEVQPPMLSLIGEENLRLTIDPLSKFSKTHKLSSDKTIFEEFEDWLYDPPAEKQKTTLSGYQLRHFGLNNGRHANGTDAKVKLEINLSVKTELPNLMAVFLAELPHVDRQIIEHIWNLENNSFVDPDYNKVPLMFVFSKTFKNAPLVIRPEQREGVAFNEINGTGVIGFDVGVGKTMTAILTFAQFMQSGRAFRPILVVPKPTYYKWIAEIRGTFNEKGELVGTGILPQYQINSFYNLGVDIQKEKLHVDENTITIITFNGGENLGFTDEYAEQFLPRINNILSQGSEGITQRKSESDKTATESMISTGQVGSVAFMDELGFDYFCMDEAHNANKIFTSVKGNVDENGKNETSRFQFSTGAPSKLAVKMFFLSQFVQQNCNGQGNVQLLTATPFTNNPLNVYNIFALTNFSRLKEYGIENVNTFFEKYVELTVDPAAVTITGSVAAKEVIKSWKNKVALQKIMFGIINYKGAKDSPSVRRPNKIVLPMLSENINGTMQRLPADEQIMTILQQTERQEQNQFQIMEDLAFAEKDPVLRLKAPFLKCESESSNNSLSPYIYEKISPSLISPEDFVDSSPKIKAMMLAIDGINKWFDDKNAERSCQIVYCAIGIEYFGLMKDYMMKKLGYKPKVHQFGKRKFFDEVEIIAGASLNNDDKEELKQAFNNGVVKVIIGSSTIREGIDLQTRTSTLHSLWIDWNATDYKQLEGRCWRFGNMFDYVRIIQYLVQGGTDSFKFQKLEEKTARTNDIFDRLNKENMIDVSDSDRNEVKWALVNNINDVVENMVKALVGEQERKAAVLKSYLDQFEDFDSHFKKLDKINNYLHETAEIARLNRPSLDLVFEDNDDLEVLKVVNRNNRKISENRTIDWTTKSKLTSYEIGMYMKQLKEIKMKLARLDEYTIKTTNLSIYETNVPLEIEKIKSQMLLIDSEIQDLKSEENHNSMYKKIHEERKASDGYATTPEIVAERILKMNDKVLNVLTVKDELTKVAPSVENTIEDKIQDNSQSVTEYLNLEETVDIASTSRNVAKIAFQYASRKMAYLQVNTYLNEVKKHGKTYLNVNGITTAKQLEAHINAIQSKARKGKGAERSKFKAEQSSLKAEQSVLEIEQMALEASKQMDEEIEKSDSETMVLDIKNAIEALESMLEFISEADKSVITEGIESLETSLLFL